MDDRLQRRLRDADPLTAADGQAPDAVRLDAIKEQIMQTEQHRVRAAFRPRPVGVMAIATASLVAVLVVATLVRPGTTALAWAPDPTPVTDAQKAAAYAACTEDIPVVGGGGATSATDRPDTPSAPTLPADFPPLVSLELHGNGGVAILADETQVGYCLLKADGDDFVYGGLTLQSARSGGPEGSMDVGAMTTEFEDVTLSIVSGTVPDGVASLRIEGGAGDGGTATVTGGRFAIWVPGAIMGGEPTDLVALDASGNELIRQPLSKAGEQPAEIEATPPGPKPSPTS